MTEHSPRYSVLVVDDEQIVRDLYRTLLNEKGHTCKVCADGLEALQILEENNIDVVITDVKMPNMDGIVLTREILKTYENIPVMVITGYTDEYSASDALNIGASEFIHKPVSPSELLVRFDKMMANHQTMTSMKNQKKTMAREVLKKLQEVNKENEDVRKTLQDEIEE